MFIEPGSETPSAGIPAPAGSSTANPETSNPGSTGDGNSNPDPSTTPAPNTPPKEESDKTQENAEPKKSETPSNDSQKQFQEIIEGWKEDRVLLDKSVKENRELKEQLQTLKSRLGKYEADDSEGEEDDTNPIEKERKIIERYESEKQAKLASQKEEVAREIGFLERTDPYFREHKNGILKVAADFNAQNLEQAIKIHRAQMAIAKKQAAPAPVAKPNTTPVKRYDPSTDSNKSIADLYRMGGIS